MLCVVGVVCGEITALDLLSACIYMYLHGCGVSANRTQRCALPALLGYKLVI